MQNRENIKQWLGDNNRFFTNYMFNLMTDCLDELQPQWISVDSNLPQVDFQVICLAGDDVEMCIFRENSDGSYYFDGLVNVTHWQPKPLPLSDGE
jgi:hypothetical protein